MSTFRYDFTIAEVAPSASGAYPLSTQSTTFMPDTSIFFQHGDTIQAKHTHPLSPPLNINYTGPDVHGANPDPSNEGSQVSGAVRTLTWSGDFTDDSGNVTDSLNDYFTQWFFFAPNNFGANAYSQKIVYRRVKITSFSASSTTVEPGSAVTISVGGLTGFPNASGANGNRLYISLFSGSTLVGTDRIGWDSGNNQLGRITTSDTSTVLNTYGSAGNLQAGNYTLYITHYGGESLLNGGAVGNRFYGSERRLRNSSGTVFSIPLTISSTADTTPDNFSIGTDVINAPLNQQIQGTQITVADIDAAASISVSGEGTPRYSIAGGGYVSSVGTVTNGQTVDFRMDASGSYADTHTASLTIGGVTDSLNVTTLANPGSGGSASGGSGTDDFGLIVKNSSGTTIFGPSIKASHTLGSNTFTVGGLGSIIVGPFENFTSTNLDTCGFLITASAGGNSFIGYSIQVTRLTGQNEGKVQIQNSSNVAISGRWYALRY